MTKSMSYLAITLFLLSATNSLAATLTCDTWDRKPIMRDLGPSYQTEYSHDESLILDNLQFECVDKQLQSEYIQNQSNYRYEKPNYNYVVKFSGAGPAAWFAMGGKMKIVCPFQEDLAGTYWGVKANAGYVLGLKAAAFASSDGSFCFLGGGDLAIGAGVTINKIEIRNGEFAKYNTANKRLQDFLDQRN